MVLPEQNPLLLQAPFVMITVLPLKTLLTMATTALLTNGKAVVIVLTGMILQVPLQINTPPLKMTI